MTEQLLQSCADYHRARAKLHDSLAAASDGESRKHHQERSVLHESWRTEIEASIAELRKDQDPKLD